MFTEETFSEKFHFCSENIVWVKGGYSGVFIADFQQAFA